MLPFSLLPWTALAVFMLGVGSLALYGLAASGHFPAELRAPRTRRGGGAVVLWATIVLATLAAVATLWLGARILPWYALVIGGGFMVLFAPLALQALPDRFVDGPGALLTFTTVAVGATVLLWGVG
jgi:hypothetical protein